jgi:Zn-dependent protease
LPDAEVLIARIAVVAFLLLVGFPFHEFAHAWTAYRLGDGTAKMFGKLTLNPMAHFDRLGGTILILSGVLLGFPVGFAQTPVNPANLRDRRNGELLVALAGPAANLLLAVLGAVAFRVLFDRSDLGSLPADIVLMFVAWNVILAIFNLLPLPPFDGQHILWRVLPARQAWQLRPMLQQYGFMIVVLIVVVGSPVLGRIFGTVTRVLVGV